MRNLKRALSLALASVMLMGMMVVGTSAASTTGFTDADEISNKEAVAIAAGLGIFDGYDDGSFGPDKVVTRAEMAVVIAKILHGADIDPTNFAGAGKFTDVPAWAEGWVNLVASLGIIEGYGDGKFGPNDTVTTVQASTMLLKALGYYVGGADTLGADWQLEVTSKATALGIYGDLSLGMNAGLTRENVAELTFNALFAQRVSYDDYRGLYVKSNDRNVVVTNGTDDDDNTLAQNTFGLYSVEGIVVANGMTDEDLSKSLKSEAQTTVMFTEDTDLNKDGKDEYEEGETYDFEVETGLDMIGHASKVYYKIVKKAPVVFAIVDQATLVAEIEYTANTTNLAKRANDAGFKKNTILDIDTEDYIVNYDMETLNVGNVTALDKLILIANDSTLEVEYVIALDQYLDVIDAYDEDEDEYNLLNADGADMNIVTEAMAEGDFAIVTDIGNQGDVLVVEPAILKDGDLTKIIGTSATVATVDKIVVDGTNYTLSTVENNKYAIDTDDFTRFQKIETIGAVTLVMDKWGEVLGLAEEAAAPNYAYIAQFGVKHSTGSLSTKDVLNAHVYFVDGTDGIYEVDTKKSSVSWKNNGSADIATMNGTANTAADWEAANGYKGLYNVKILSNGKIDVDPLTTNVTAAAAANGVSLVKGLSTLVTGANTTAQAAVTTNAFGAADTLLNSNDTVYFYVTGNYGDDDLSVKVITGIKNVITHKNDTTADDETIAGSNLIGTGIQEAYATDIKGGKVHTERAELDVMLIQGVTVEGTDVYYYDRDYNVTETEDGFVVTYTLWSNETGESIEVTYDNGGKGYDTEAAAKAEAYYVEVGFYTIGSKELKPEFTYSTDVNDGAQDGFGWKLADKVYYLVNDVAVYDDWNDNLVSTMNKVGSITENTKIVDLTNNGLTTIAKIAKAIKTAGDGNVLLSYSYDKDYNTEILFVTSYTPKHTDAPNAGTVNAGIDSVAIAGNTLTITMEAGATMPTKVDVVVRSYSSYTGAWSVMFDKTMDVTAGTVTIPAHIQMTGAGVSYEVSVDGVIAE